MSKNRKVCKSCIKKSGLRGNGGEFLPGECTKCGEYAFVQAGRHKIVNYPSFFDSARPVDEVRRGRIKHV